MKVIASDYDGTLDFGGIDDKKREAIARWQEAGNLFGIVSGRMVKSIEQRMIDANISPDFMIASSGGKVVTGDGKTLSLNVIDNETALKLAALMLNHGARRVNIHTQFYCFVKPDGEQLKKDEFYLSTLPQISGVSQVAAECVDASHAIKLKEIINERIPNTFNPLQNNRVVDVVPEGVNKAKGIYTLINNLGIPKENVIAVGDNENDIDMLKEFNSYAMANGSEGAKAAAKNITTGICELIEKEL